MDVGGPQALHLRSLIWLFTIVCGIIWLLVMSVLIGAVLRDRATAPSPSADRTARQLVIAAVTATVVIISGLTLVSYFTTRSIAETGPNAVAIEVRGYQWWWEVRYKDRATSENFITANEIHVPIGRPVRIELAAEDVIHSFWAPNLAGKQDLIPGRDNSLSFSIDRPSVYRQQCAEFCGLQHAHMAMLIVAEAPADFERWRAAQLAEANTPQNATEQAGQKIFLAKPCATCHTIRGTGAAGTTAPDLTHVAERQSIAAGMLPTTRGSLAAWIADPQRIKPGNNMPLVPLTAAELNALSAYLAALK
jgi:cytochrome c oxidase subunit 2